MQIFKTIEKHFRENLPFVVYKKPNTNNLLGFFQNDDRLNFVKNFKETGFVFCNFSGDKNIIFRTENAVVVNEKIDVYDDLKLVKNYNISNKNNKEHHIKLVKKGIKAIENNVFDKVVLSRKEEIELVDFDFIQSLKKLLNSNQNSFVYIWFHPKVGFWMGAFSEQLLKISNLNFSTMSLAGTQKYESSTKANWKLKEIQEQQIVTDFIVESLKNDIESIEIEKPETIKSGNILHLKSDIFARLKPSYDLEQLIKKLHPTPAVCGFPKQNSKAFILDNEKYDREFYAGFLGELNMASSKNIKTTDLFVNLRCMKIDQNQVTIYVGGGITKDSVPELEWDETVSKSLTIKSILN